MTQTLYAIQNDYQELLAELEASIADDTLTPDQLDALNARLAINQAEFLTKADAYAAIIRQKKARVEFLKAEAKRLLDMAKAEEAVGERLKARISDAMTLQGLTKAETAHYKLSFRNSEAVEISCEPDMLPVFFQRTKLVHEPDRELIKTELKAGGSIQGAALVTRQSLQIR